MRVKAPQQNSLGRAMPSHGNSGWVCGTLHLRRFMWGVEAALEPVTPCPYIYIYIQRAFSLEPPPRLWRHCTIALCVFSLVMWHAVDAAVSKEPASLGERLLQSALIDQVGKMLTQDRSRLQMLTLVCHRRSRCKMK